MFEDDVITTMHLFKAFANSKHEMRSCCDDFYFLPTSADLPPLRFCNFKNSGHYQDFRSCNSQLDAAICRAVALQALPSWFW